MPPVGPALLPKPKSQGTEAATSLGRTVILPGCSVARKHHNTDGAMAVRVDSTYEVEHFSSVNAPGEQNEAVIVPVKHAAMTLPEMPVITGHTALEGGPRIRTACV